MPPAHGIGLTRFFIASCPSPLHSVALRSIPSFGCLGVWFMVEASPYAVDGHDSNDSTPRRSCLGKGIEVSAIPHGRRKILHCLGLDDGRTCYLLFSGRTSCCDLVRHRLQNCHRLPSSRLAQLPPTPLSEHMCPCPGHSVRQARVNCSRRFPAPLCCKRSMLV